MPLPELPSIKDLTKLGRHKCLLSLRIIIVFLLCFFTVVPSVVLWIFVGSNSTISAMNDEGRVLLEGISYQLRTALMANATNAFMSLISPTEDVMQFTANVFQTSLHGTASADNAVPDCISSHMFFTLKTCPTISSFGFMKRVYVHERQGQTGFDDDVIQQYQTFLRLNWDLLQNQSIPTIYAARMAEGLYPNGSSVTLYLVNQETGVLGTSLSQYSSDLLGTIPPAVGSDVSWSWYGTVEFDPLLGMSLLLQQFVPTRPAGSGYVILVYTTVSTVSSFLASMLHGPKERLFLFFRNSEGVLLGASHGMYLSLSDTDGNPFQSQPPVVGQLSAYSALESTDATIRATGQYLRGTYLGWDAIPELNVEVSVLGESYWLTTALYTSKLQLKVELALLVDVASQTGPISGVAAAMASSTKSTNTSLTIILSVTVACALSVALVLSHVLTRSLSGLSRGMNALATLQFDKELISRESHFIEICRCQQSFWTLERGMKAFIRYIPRDVVKMMLVGQMPTTQIMTKKTITIMFMDIAAFSSLCELISSETLVQMTSLYLQAMCDVIIRYSGTLDKFIGDCIMAMWNAPKLCCEPETSACLAALDMQAELVKLWDLWEHQGLEKFKFRIGLHTDEVLVGNFGCDYRLNYTCLGDGVNIASYLESVNKGFGSVALVSPSTFLKASRLVYFRKLGRIITVPSKAPATVEVYEPLLKFRTPLPEEYIFNDRVHLGLENARLLDCFENLSGMTLHLWTSVPKETLLSVADAYEQGLDYFSRGNVAEARPWFQRALETLPSDSPSAVLLHQCERSGPQRAADPMAKELEGGVLFDNK